MTGTHGWPQGKAVAPVGILVMGVTLLFLASLLCSSSVVSEAPAASQPGNAALPAVSASGVLANESSEVSSFPTAIKHVVVIMDENQNYSTVLADGPFEAYLAHTYATATNDYALFHGSTHAYEGATSPVELNSWPNPSKNIGDLVGGAGLTWDAFEESMPTVCDHTTDWAVNYDTDHNPFIMYSDISGTLCDDHDLKYTSWTSAVSNGSIPNYSFITPNTIDDDHNGSSQSAEIKNGDAWLKSFLTPLVNDSTIFSNTAFLITFDEDAGTKTTTPTVNIRGQNASGGHIYMVVVSPYSKGLSSSTLYDTYSLLTTAEWLLGFSSGAIGGNDSWTLNPPMEDLFSFGPPLKAGTPSATPNPLESGEATTISTTAATGGSGGYSYYWSSSATITGTGCPTTTSTNLGQSFSCTPTGYTSPTVFTVTATYHDSDGNTVTASFPLTVNPDPSIAVTPATSPVAYDVGQPASALTGTVTYTGGNPVAVQWYSSPTSAPCSTSSPWSDSGLPSGSSPVDVTPSTTSAGTTYYCAVVTESGGADAVVGSNVVEVIVNADPTVAVTPVGPVTLDKGQTSALTATATYTGPNAATIQWYSSSTSAPCSTSSPWSATGSAGASPWPLTPSTVSEGTTWYCAVVTDSGVSGYSSPSNVVNVTVGPALTAGTASATVNPVDVDQATVISTSGAGGGSGSYTYAWTGLPPGCSSLLPSFSCTPSSNSGSPYLVVLTVTDTNGAHATSSFDLTVLSIFGITVSPIQGPVGATVTVAGTDFAPSAKLTSLVFDSKTISSCTSGSLTTNSGGAFSCTFKVPSGTSGTKVIATNKGGATATGTFTVTTPAITVSPKKGPVGTSVTVAGSGFSVSTALSSLVFDSVTISSCTTGSLTTGTTGAFSCTFLVPGGTSGTKVKATDVSTKTATATFTVTKPAITLSKTTGAVGTTFKVTGSGFSESSGATVSFNGVDLVPTACTSGTFSGTMITTTAAGGFVCTFTVPSETAGPYAVVGEDMATGDLSAAKTFTVTG